MCGPKGRDKRKNLSYRVHGCEQRKKSLPRLTAIKQNGPNAGLQAPPSTSKKTDCQYIIMNKKKEPRSGEEGGGVGRFQESKQIHWKVYTLFHKKKATGPSGSGGKGGSRTLNQYPKCILPLREKKRANVSGGKGQGAMTVLLSSKDIHLANKIKRGRKGERAKREKGGGTISRIRRRRAPWADPRWLKGGKKDPHP